MMYEGVLLFGVVFIAGYAFDTLTQSRHALMLRHARQVCLFFFIGLYFIACWRRSGQTLPMKAWNIRLTDTNGGRPSFAKLAVRYALMWLLPMAATAVIWGLTEMTGWTALLMLSVAAPFTNFIPTWFTQGQQFWHDRLAGTALIEVTG
jgi:uncharacterized RDD family membrane protein YckC